MKSNQSSSVLFHVLTTLRINSPLFRNQNFRPKAEKFCCSNLLWNARKWGFWRKFCPPQGEILRISPNYEITPPCFATTGNKGGGYFIRIRLIYKFVYEVISYRIPIYVILSDFFTVYGINLAKLKTERSGRAESKVYIHTLMRKKTWQKILFFHGELEFSNFGFGFFWTSQIFTMVFPL